MYRRTPFPRRITLDINLGDATTVVTSDLELERNADLPGSDLFLDGEELKLLRVHVRGGEVKEAVQLQVNQRRVSVAGYEVGKTCHW